MMKKVLLIPVLVLSAFGCAPADTAQPSGGGSGGSSAGSGGSSANTGGAPASGTGGLTASSGGSSASSGGNTAETGGMTGNSGGSAANSGGATGSGGSIGSGGMITTGTGGGVTATGGRGGTVGTGGASVATGGAMGSLLDVAKPLNGQMLLGPCVVDRLTSVCHTVPTGQACPSNPTDRALSGVLTTNKTVKLGGTMGQPYTITLHIQGEVESKQYTGGVDQNSTAQHPKADGFCTGGTPSTANDYNVYMIRVTNPGATTHTDYFLNSLQGPGVSNHTTYGVDYITGPIKAQGGSSIQLVAGDSNCDMIKNCGPTVNDGSVCAAPIVVQNIDSEALSLNPTFNFTTPYNGQWLAMVVKTVTSP